MEIKRTTEIFVETKRRFVVSQPEHAERILCPHCAAQMIEAETAASLLAVSRRSVYRRVENGEAHFAETEAGILLVCPNWLGGEPKKPE